MREEIARAIHMTTQRTAELIARLEKATGPDREIDSVIWRTADFANWDRECSFKGFRYAGHTHTRAEKRQHENRMSEHYAPKFTTSIDAALTLVPERCWPMLSVYAHGVFGAHCWLIGPLHEFASNSAIHGEAYLAPQASASFTDATKLWPVAICIAALKARADLANGDGK
jgi:hypothetical protein